MKTTNIDVIIPSYNDADKIGDAIASIQQQEDVLDYKINYNIIIIDDCSTKSNYELLKRYEVKYDNVSVLKTKSNSGAAVARNHGLKLTKSPFISFLDADDIWLKDKIKHLLPLFKDPILDVAYGAYVLDIKPGVKFTHKVVEGKPEKAHFLLSATLVRKAVFEKGYYFDEEFRFAEDLEWNNRIKADGLNIRVIDKPVFIYKIHGNNSVIKHPEEAAKFRLKALHKKIKYMKKKEK